MKNHNEFVNDKYTLSASQVIYGAYVKIVKLRQLVYDTYGNSSIASATKLNIFVDINSILHPLYSENNRVVIENITDISAGIINLCAHYRSFFRENLSVDTRFFLINSLNTCDLYKKYVLDYNAKFEAKVNVTQSKKLIDNNMKLLEVLCPYLPAIYYIPSYQQFETGVVIAHLIESLNDGNPNLIISHDMYPLQLCSQYKWTSYLYPFKNRNKETNEVEDNSWMIPVNDKESFRHEFWNKYANARRIQGSTLASISPINYPLFLAMTKMPERNLNGVVYSVPTATKIINSIVGSEDVKIDHSQLLMHPELSNGTIIARHQVLDIQCMLPFYRNSPEANNIKLLDLNDVPKVNQIVSKYYANNPIDLQKL